MHKAVSLDMLDVVRCLIARGANINAKLPHQRYNIAAIHMATHNMNVDIMRTLLEAGADVNIRDGKGQTAMHFLCNSVDGTIETALECCEILIQNCSRLDILDSTQSTPLDNAFNNHTRLVLAIYIISAGGDAVYQTRSQTQLFRSIRSIPKKIRKVFREFLFESGFPIIDFISTIRDGDEPDWSVADVRETYMLLKYQVPLSLKRLSANVIRKAMVPNAWVGIKPLPLPPGFDKQYIILHPKHVVSSLIQGHE